MRAGRTARPALDTLAFDVARRHYGPVLDRLKAADADDRSGYLGKYRFDANGLVEREVWPRLKEKRYEEALAFLDKKLANRRLLTTQRQELLAMRSAVYKAWPGHASEAREALGQLIALDPRSDVAVGARKRLADLELQETVTWLREGVQKAHAGKDPAALAQAQERYLRIAGRDATLGKLPKFDPPPGGLLSAEGRVTFSSVSRPHGEPWKHFLVGRDVAPGAFHTDHERRPWVQVELPRPRTLTGIVVVNRDGNGSRQVPLRIQVSADGTTWQDVYRNDRDQRLWRVDFTDRRPTVRFVRVGRDDDRAEFFHLANVLVYGE
ncbi:MAG: discoidin domain-containing protein [Gemmataceae bacterium]